MVPASVFLLSLSSLVFEVVLTRFFSLSQGSALAFLAVGVAMLGCAAGGSVHAMASERRGSGEAGARRSFAFLVPAAALAAPAVLFLALRLPFDHLRLPLDPVQGGYLLLLLPLLSLPFFLCGLATCAAYAEAGRRSGRVAFCSLAGSALGALLPFALFPLLGEGRTLAAASALLVLPALASSAAELLRRPAARAAAAAAAAMAALAVQVPFLAEGRLLELPLSPYAPLSQLLRVPGTRILETRTDIRGRMVSVESPAYRPVQGLSLGFDGVIPAQGALFRDGDAAIAPCGPSDGQRIRAASFTLPFCGWVLAGPSPRSLILLSDGGSGLACALAAGTGETTVVVDHPWTAERLQGVWEAKDPSGRAAGPARFPVSGPRAFLAGTEARFRLIQVERWGTSMPGLESLSAGFLYTEDAFRACLRHLDADGVLVVPRRLLLPPADIVRLFSTALRALSAEGVRSPLDHVAVARSWDASLLLASPSPLTGDRLALLREFASSRGFDLDWFPGVTDADVNLHNRFARPYHYEALRASLEDGFFRSYPLDVSVQTDDRPYPSRFLKWLRIGEFYRSTGSRPHVLLLSGEASVALMLAAAVLVTAAALLLPAAVRARRGRARSPGEGPRLPAFLAFAACGAGFVFAEMHMLDAMALVWNDPSECFAVVLGWVLASSAAGGMASGGIGGRGFPIVLPALPIAMAAACFVVPAGARFALGLPGSLRPVLAFLLLAPPSFLMGMPFPLLMRLLAPAPKARALSWTVNGCASVLASVLSAGIAMAAGVRALAILSAACYAVMTAAVVGALRRGFH